LIVTRTCKNRPQKVSSYSISIREAVSNRSKLYVELKANEAHPVHSVIYLDFRHADMVESFLGNHLNIRTKRGLYFWSH